MDKIVREPAWLLQVYRQALHALIQRTLRAPARQIKSIQTLYLCNKISTVWSIRRIQTIMMQARCAEEAIFCFPTENSHHMKS
jgi:hypothetical protein